VNLLEWVLDTYTYIPHGTGENKSFSAAC
jgi:hypothetical protein